jgi:hypothetical protein
MTDRPLGITILCILAATFGFFAVIAGFSVFGFGAFIGSAASILGGPFTAVGAMIGAVGVLEVVFALGAWFGRRWAWAFGVWIELASIVLSIAWVALGAMAELQVISILVVLSILHDLDGVEVRRALGRGPARWSAGSRRR